MITLAKSPTEEFLIGRPMPDVVEELTLFVRGLFVKRITFPGLYSLGFRGFGLFVTGLLDVLLLLLFVLVGSENLGFGINPVNKTSPFFIL